MLSIFHSKIGENSIVRFSENPIQAGFPSPAEDFSELELDIYKYLIEDSVSTFFARAKGNSMQNVGIFNNDILVVDRSKEAKNNDIVVAVVNGEFTVKRYRLISGKAYLYPENPEFKPIEISEESESRIWGKVTFVIHKPE